jgi:hypothetical protein
MPLVLASSGGAVLGDSSSRRNDAPATLSRRIGLAFANFARPHNIPHNLPRPDRVAGEIKARTRLALLQEVESVDAAQPRRALGMEANYYPQLITLGKPRRLAGDLGDLILLKYPPMPPRAFPTGGESFACGRMRS